MSRASREENRPFAAWIVATAARPADRYSFPRTFFMRRSSSDEEQRSDVDVDMEEAEAERVEWLPPPRRLPDAVATEFSLVLLL